MLRSLIPALALLVAAPAAQAQSITRISPDGNTTTYVTPRGTYTTERRQDFMGGVTITESFQPRRRGYQPMGPGGYQPMGQGYSPLGH